MSQFEDSGQVPLHHVAAEEAALSCMIFSPACLKELCNFLVEDDFYRPAHRLLFKAFRDLHFAGKPVDMITLEAPLAPVLELIGGWDYVVGLVMGAYTAANAAYYAEIIKEKAELRRIEQAAKKWIGDVNTGTKSVDVLAQMAKAAQSKFDFVEYAKIGDVDASKEDVGLSTGFATIDRKLSTRGLPMGQMTAILAQEKAGKSALMLQICAEACRLGRKVLYIAIADLNRERVKQRLLRGICGFSTVHSADRHGFKDEFLKAQGEIDFEWRLDVRDMKSRQNPTDVDLLRTEIEIKQEGKSPYDEIFVDYGQKLTTKKIPASNPVGIAEHCSSQISELAETVGIPFVIGSQVTEGNAKSGTETITKGARKWLEDCGLALLVTVQDGNAREIEIFRSRFGGMGLRIPFVWNDENLIFQPVNPNL